MCQGYPEVGVSLVPCKGIYRNLERDGPTRLLERQGPTFLVQLQPISCVWQDRSTLMPTGAHTAGARSCGSMWGLSLMAITRVPVLRFRLCGPLYGLPHFGNSNFGQPQKGACSKVVALWVVSGLVYSPVS